MQWKEISKKVTKNTKTKPEKKEVRSHSNRTPKTSAWERNKHENDENGNSRTSALNKKRKATDLVDVNAFNEDYNLNILLDDGNKMHNKCKENGCIKDFKDGNHYRRQYHDDLIAVENLNEEEAVHKNDTPVSDNADDAMK